MKAIVQNGYGSAEVLQLEDIDRPMLNDDQVLVRVHAAAVNPADWFVMTGAPYLMRLAFGLARPRDRVRGQDVAGTVEAIGDRVTRFQPGDEVFGACEAAFAEYACAKEKTLVAKPAGLTFEQAAAVPMAALAALQGLRDTAGLQSGQKVLINGASGGIGTFAVQIAKSLGAEVTGVCGTRNVEMVRSIGADHVIDYTQEDFTQGEQRYDVIFDNVANHPLSRLSRVLTPRGTLVTNNGEGGRWLGPLGRMLAASVRSLVTRRRLRWFLSLPKTEDLAALKDLIEAGRLTPVIGATYSLSEAPQALAEVGQGHARGKVVVTVRGADRESSDTGSEGETS